MTDPTPAEVATAFIEAFGRRDLAACARLVDEGVVFESPRMRLTGARDVLAAIGGFAEAVASVEVIAVVGDDTQALVMYDMRTGPFGTLRAADRLVVRAGRIVLDQLVFDTRPLS